MTNFTIVNENKTKRKATMTLTGYVASFNSENTFNSAKFLETFNDLKERNDHIHIDILNLFGGSIIEGIPVYNGIKETAAAGDIKITGKIEGLAASMGSIIAMAIPVADLEMGNMARLMNHKAKGGAFGTAEQIKNAAESIQSYEDDMVDILAERTGLTADDVKSKWMDGLDHFIKSAEAKKLKLVGKVTKSNLGKKLPSNYKTPEEVYNFFETHLQVNLQTDMNLEQQLRDVLNLGADANLVDAVTALQTDAAYKTKYDALLQSNQDKDTAEAKALVQKAIDGKHIKEDQKEVYLALFKADHANAKTVVEGIIDAVAPTGDKQKRLDDALAALETGASGSGTPEAKNYEWYEQNDPQALLAMKDNEPEKFHKLFDESIKA